MFRIEVLRKQNYNNEKLTNVIETTQYFSTTNGYYV
jgi:hypothetical protein